MRIALGVLILIIACAAPPSVEPGRELRAPYLHPTARLVFPEQILDLRVSDVHEFGPSDVSASYRATGVLLTVYIYPANLIPGGVLDDHLNAALMAIREQWGVETATRLDLALDGDPRGPALAALFEVDRPPGVSGVLSVFQACSHVVKFRLSSGRAVTQDRRFEILDAAATDAVLPRDFTMKALESFGPGACGVEFTESEGESHASGDGCEVFWNPDSGPDGLEQALCAALDAKVASQGSD
jgi:hypothetical protein